MKRVLFFFTILLLSLQVNAQIKIYDTNNFADVTSIKIHGDTAYCKVRTALVPFYAKIPIRHYSLMLKFDQYDASSKDEYTKIPEYEYRASSFDRITETEYNNIINETDVPTNGNNQQDIAFSISPNEGNLWQTDKSIKIKANFNIKTKEYMTNMSSFFFTVSEAKDKSLIGKKVFGHVVFSRRSNIGGTEGNIVIRPLYILVDKKTRIPLMPTDIYARGKNRTNIKFWCTLFGLVPAIFVPGSGACISEGTTFDAYIQ